MTVFANPFVITGRDDEEREERREEVRQRVAFYASTPTYKDVMAHHGWEDVGRELHGLSREGEWNEITNLVTDEMLEVFAIETPIDKVANSVRDEYGDVADRVLLSLDFDDEPYWKTIVDGFWE